MQNKGLSSLQTGVMAVSAGVCVANIYFNQPILNNIAASFNATENEVGNVSVLTQVGYGAGLFFLTPLGDKVSRKNLVFCLQLLLIAALLCLTFANSLFLVCLMSLFTGIFAVSAQVILPMAASLATENRGKTVGIIFTGILVGILTARVFAGYITQWLGWRYVYGISAGLVLVIAIIFRWLVPDVKQQFTGNYLKLLSSTLLQVKRFALLRRTALLGALIFGIFCSFWTTVTFHLSGAPFHYRPDTIGLFGILAIGGALLAPAFGKLADKGNPARSQLLTVLLIIVGVLMIKLFAYSVISFIVAVLLLDVGVQATQVTNVATIYTLDQAAHSRINTVYMTSYFMGGAIGTFAGIRCWAIGGWQLVTWQMLLWSLLSLAVVLMGFKRKTAAQPTAY